MTGEKARLVVRGDQQSPKPSSEDTYASTPSAAEIRILYSIITQLGRPVHSCDVSQAFVQSNDLPKDSSLYIYPPHGYHYNPDVVWKLVKPLYCLSIAPKAWADTLKEFINWYGFIPVNCSETFYVCHAGNGESIHLVYHVDDLLFSFSNDQLGLHFKNALLTSFKARDDGPVKCFVGIDVTRDDTHTHLTQTPLTDSLLADF